jgi:hypothetical protein
VPKYVITLLAYSIINLDPYSDITTIHRRPSASGQPKLASKQVTVLKTVAPVAIAAVTLQWEGLAGLSYRQLMPRTPSGVFLNSWRA